MTRAKTCENDEQAQAPEAAVDELLRRLWREGLESGDAGPADFEALKEAARRGGA